MGLEAKFIAIAVLVIALASGVLYLDYHWQHKGELKCEKADTTALQAQLADAIKKRDAYAAQLKDANANLSSAQTRLAALAAQPVPHLVCHSADPIPVRQVPAQTDGGLATAGPLDSVHERSFDPGPTIRGLSVAYEKRVERARDALNRWPTQ
jgi:hypothetical protein